MATSKRGIFCIETSHWNSGASRQPTVEKLLELIQGATGAPFIHRDFSTKEELHLLLAQAKQAAFAKYPLIYLASHGDSRQIAVSKVATTSLVTKSLSLQDLANLMIGYEKKKGAVLFISACGVMDCHATYLKQFVLTTGIKAIIGYKKKVDWIESAQLELGLLAALAVGKSTLPSLKKVFKNLSAANHALIKTLGLRTFPNLLP